MVQLLALVLCWWECQWCSCFGKHFGSFSVKLNVPLPVTLSIYPRTYVHKRLINKRVDNSQTLETAQMLRCPPVGEWLKLPGDWSAWPTSVQDSVDRCWSILNESSQTKSTYSMIPWGCAAGRAGQWWCRRERWLSEEAGVAWKGAWGNLLE